jgi:hypothetical protein
MIDKEESMEVIHFMLGGTRKKPLGLEIQD